MRYEPAEILLSLEELTELCAEWQETLRLQDWMVGLAIVRGNTLNRPKTAQIVITVETKKALVSIVDPIDYPTDQTAFPLDMEQALVHELVHLHLEAFWPEGEDAHVLAEQAVDLIACGLIAAKRGRDAP